MSLIERGDRVLDLAGEERHFVVGFEIVGLGTMGVPGRPFRNFHVEEVHYGLHEVRSAVDLDDVDVGGGGGVDRRERVSRRGGVRGHDGVGRRERVNRRIGIARVDLVESWRHSIPASYEAHEGVEGRHQNVAHNSLLGICARARHSHHEKTR